jgi:hypothetical protein
MLINRFRGALVAAIVLVPLAGCERVAVPDERAPNNPANSQAEQAELPSQSTTLKVSKKKRGTEPEKSKLDEHKDHKPAVPPSDPKKGAQR